MLKFQFIIFRALDLLALIASNAYTGTVAGMIAFENASDSDAVRKLVDGTFLPVGTLAWTALLSILAYELLVVALLVCHIRQCHKVLKAANLPRFYLNGKDFDKALTDPLYRQQYQLAKSKKTEAMSSVALGTLLMAVGIIAAMYLSNTALTPYGLPAGKFSYVSYGAPLLMALLVVLGIVALSQSGSGAQLCEQRWIRLNQRAPKLADVRAGFIGDTVLCRSPHNVEQWGGRYFACKVSKINGRHMPPASQWADIEWAKMPE